MEKHIIAIFFEYGALAILLLFCNHQDTESESQEIDIGVTEPIFTLKILKTIWDNYMNTAQDGRKNIVANPHIYGSIAIFLLFCDNKYTESD